MKKGIKIAVTLILIISICFIATISFAQTPIIGEELESRLIELKDDTLNSIEDYNNKYGDEFFGTVAYILNLVRIYSIPLCFLGIVIGAIHQYILGVRKLDTLEKGMALMVSFTTILIICQILPLAFAIFVRFGRG